MPAMYDDPVVKNLKRMERRVDNLTLPEISPDLISPFLSLPMLRGFWADSVASGGTWHDLSGHGNNLTYNGDPDFNYSGLAGYWDLDGTGDYFSITDAASGNDFDVIGTEGYVTAAIHGLSVGGWFWFDDAPPPTNLEYLIAKDDLVAGNRAFSLFRMNVAGNIYFNIYNSANVLFSNNSGIVAQQDQWYFIAVTANTNTNAVTFRINEQIVAGGGGCGNDIDNSSADLTIGASDVPDRYLDGRAALCFVCAASLSDAQISSVWEQTRPAFAT